MYEIYCQYNILTFTQTFQSPQADLVNMTTYHLLVPFHPQYIRSSQELYYNLYNTKNQLAHGIYNYIPRIMTSARIPWQPRIESLIQSERILIMVA